MGDREASRGERLALERSRKRDTGARVSIRCGVDRLAFSSFGLVRGRPKAHIRLRLRLRRRLPGRVGVRVRLSGTVRVRGRGRVRVRGRGRGGVRLTASSAARSRCASS